MGKQHIFEIWRYRSNFRKTLSYCAIRRVVLGLRSKSSLRSLRKCIQNLDFFQAQKFHRVRLSPAPCGLMCNTKLTDGEMNAKVSQCACNDALKNEPLAQVQITSLGN